MPSFSLVYMFALLKSVSRSVLEYSTRWKEHIKNDYFLTHGTTIHIIIFVTCILDRGHCYFGQVYGLHSFTFSSFSESLQKSCQGFKNFFNV